MTAGTLTIKPYFGGLYGPFARLFIFGMALAITAGAIFAGLTLGSGLWFFAICFFALAANGIVFFASFTYTEFDEHHVAKVFCLGRFFRRSYNVVKWEEVLMAQSGTSLHQSLIYLQITKKNGQKMIFTAPPRSAGANGFDEIVRHFQKGSPLEHA